MSIQESCIEQLLGDGHIGPIYEEVVSHAVSDGAFYTLGIPAILLAGLTLHPQAIDWDDDEAISNLRILDPSCGTGILLVAALLIAKYRNGGAAGHTTPKCVGLDINDKALEFAEKNLLAHADSDSVMIKRMPHGPLGNDDVALGSLELLSDVVELPVNKMFGKGCLERLLGTKYVNVVLANPPYTNNKKRSTKFTSEEKRKMQDRELKLKAHVESCIPEAKDVIHSNSIGSFFTPLIDGVLDKDTGMFGELLPATAFTSKSGFAGRKFLSDKFHIEMIITSHDLSCPNMSVDTGIHESMVIGVRKTAKNKSKPTRFISLNHMPKNLAEALDWLGAVHAGKKHEFHKEMNWPVDRIEKGNWTPVQFYDGVLSAYDYQLQSVQLLSPLNTVAKLGPTIQGVHPTFQNPLKSNKVSFPDNMFVRAYPLFWTHKTEKHKTMEVTPEVYCPPKVGREDFVRNHLWKGASNLLVVNRINVHTVRTPSILCDVPVLGCPWIPITPNASDVFDTKTIMKMWCVFMNSTFGALQLLNRRAKDLFYARYNPVQMLSILLPDPSDTELDVLSFASVYDEFKNKEFERWGNMGEDMNRALLDEKVANLLGLDKDLVDDWRQRIASEPVVSRRV